MSSKTIVEIKNELDNLGITYKSGLRKAELLALLQETADTPENHYSPPYTRRKTMATSGNSEAPTNIFKLESSPLNHASAVIEELEATSDQSEQISVGVEITKEQAVADEHIMINETDNLATSVTTDGTDSDDVLEKAAVTPQVPRGRRRSERLQQKAATHAACSVDGTLFSAEDEEKMEPPQLAPVPGPKDSVESKHEKPVELDKPDVITKSEVAELSAARKKFVGYFFLALLFLIIANIVGYVLKYYPISLDDIHLTLTSLSRHLNPTSTSTDELQ